MQAYIIRRLLLIIPTLFLITIIVFLLVRFIPGDIVDLMISESAQRQETIELDRETIERSLGLDVPAHIQYGRWLGILPKPDEGFSGVLQGDLGVSLRGGRSITEEIVRRLPVTFELGLMALIIGASVSLPIGIYSAMRQDTMGDYVGRTLAILCVSIPPFWAGTMVMVYPAVWWGWSPSMVLIPLFEDPIGNLGMFLIPAIIMGLTMMGTSMRMTRTMMLEVLRQDYIRTAWSKGLVERQVILRHAAKNAFIPVVTILGTQLTIMIGGGVVIEQIFCLPGLGLLMLEALNQRDYPMISGINLFVATFVSVINLLVDLTYATLDPRIRYR